MGNSIKFTRMLQRPIIQSRKNEVIIVTINLCLPCGASLHTSGSLTVAAVMMSVNPFTRKIK